MEVKFLQNRSLASKIVGIGLLIMAIISIFSFGFVFSTMVNFNDTQKTVTEISNNLNMFISGTIGWMLIITIDLLVSLTIYIYIKPYHKTLAILTMISRMVYVLFLIVAVSHLIKVYVMISKANFLDVDIMSHLHCFHHIWSMGLIIFGLHLLLLDFTIINTTEVPKLVSILIITAGISYVLVHTLYTVTPSLDAITNVLDSILALPMALGELAFAIWILIYGRKKL